MPRASWHGRREAVAAHKKEKAQRAQQRQQERNPLVAMAAKIRDERGIVVLIEGGTVTANRTVFGRYTEERALTLLRQVEQSRGKLNMAEIELEDVEALVQVRRPLDFQLLVSARALRVYFAGLNECVVRTQLSYRPQTIKRGIIMTVNDRDGKITPLYAADLLTLEAVVSDFDRRILGCTLTEYLETFWVNDLWQKNHGRNPGEYDLRAILGEIERA